VQTLLLTSETVRSRRLSLSRQCSGYDRLGLLKESNSCSFAGNIGGTTTRLALGSLESGPRQCVGPSPPRDALPT
jgi:hypothetical protein